MKFETRDDLRREVVDGVGNRGRGKAGNAGARDPGLDQPPAPGLTKHQSILEPLTREEM